MKHSGVIFLLAPGISQTERQRVPHHPQIFVRMPSPLQHPACGGLAAVRMAWFRGCTVLRDCNHCIGYAHPAPPAPQILSFAFARAERLRPDDIQLNEKRVLIHPRTSKTGGGRVVPLRKAAQLRGILLRIPRNWHNRWKALRRAAGFTRWVPDVCRHTFASYHAAYFKNLPELQLEMGHNTPSLLRSRYLNLPRTAQAADFWRPQHMRIDT